MLRSQRHCNLESKYQIFSWMTSILHIPQYTNSTNPSEANSSSPVVTEHNRINEHLDHLSTPSYGILEYKFFIESQTQQQQQQKRSWLFFTKFQGTRIIKFKILRHNCTTRSTINLWNTSLLPFFLFSPFYGCRI